MSDELYDEDPFEDYDGSGSLKVNLSGEEAASEGRDAPQPLPKGWHRMAVTKGEIKTVKEVKADGTPNKNAGKPYWSLELTVTDGKFKGRKAFHNVMLFAGAAYSLVQLLKATGRPVSEGEIEVPPLDDIVSEDVEFDVRVSVVPASKQYDARNEVKAVRAPGSGSDALEADDDLDDAMMP